jgi:hypothetical protein
MFNWFDLMRQAQTSAGFDALTRQFQLSGDQSQKAVAAFMPAFVMGLQHAMTSNDPNRFFQSLMGGGYENFWLAASRSFTPQAQQEGRRLLDQLFGSDEVSRRVAHQAANYAGISAETMQQMLPLLAGILAGGMSQWMGAQAKAVHTLMPQSEKEKASAANPWAELWDGWMKAASPEKKPGVNPMEEMMKGFLQMSSPPKPPPPPQASPSWEEMMDKGREMQSQYLASLQAIFADAWKNGSRGS